LQRIMDGENRSVSAGQRQQTRVVVLVNVHNLGAPSAELSSYLEHRRDRRDRPAAPGNDEHLDTFAPESVQEFVSLHRRTSELQCVRTEKYCNVVTDVN